MIEHIRVIQWVQWMSWEGSKMKECVSTYLGLLFEASECFGNDLDITTSDGGRLSLGGSLILLGSRHCRGL